jgi:prepilin-type processing-associated H-X9-DG protein
MGGEFANTAPGTSMAPSAERADLIAAYFLNRGLNTNYAASWHLCRTTPRVVADTATTPATIKTNGVATGEGLKGVNSTVGPLTRRLVEGGPVHSSKIALLGDGAPGDIDEASMAIDLAIGPGHLFSADESAKTFIQQGDLLCEAMNDGPAYYKDATDGLELIAAQGANLSTQIREEKAGDITAPTGPTGSATYLQDTRDWYAVHGGGSKSSANILMADNSVKQFNDQNGDKFLNPGFPVPNNLTDAQYGGIGYKDGTVEIAPAEMFNGIFLTDVNKQKFE